MCYKCLFGQVPSGNATCKHTRQDTWVTCTDFNRVGLPDASQILPWKPILSFGWGSRRTEHQFKCVGCIGITVPSPLSRFQTNTWKISKKEATLMHLLTTWSGLEAGFFQPWWTLQELTKTHKQKTITSAMFLSAPLLLIPQCRRISGQMTVFQTAAVSEMKATTLDPQFLVSASGPTAIFAGIQFSSFCSLYNKNSEGLMQ